MSLVSLRSKAQNLGPDLGSGWELWYHRVKTNSHCLVFLILLLCYLLTHTVRSEEKKKQGQNTVYNQRVLECEVSRRTLWIFTQKEALKLHIVAPFGDQRCSTADRTMAFMWPIQEVHMIFPKPLSLKPGVNPDLGLFAISFCNAKVQT